MAVLRCVRGYYRKRMNTIELHRVSKMHPSFDYLTETRTKNNGKVIQESYFAPLQTKIFRVLLRQNKPFANILNMELSYTCIYFKYYLDTFCCICIWQLVWVDLDTEMLFPE